MTHWDMLNKAAIFEFSLFNMSQCVICSPVWRFFYHVIAQLQKAHRVIAFATLSDWLKNFAPVVSPSKKSKS